MALRPQRINANHKAGLCTVTDGTTDIIQHVSPASGDIAPRDDAMEQGPGHSVTAQPHTTLLPES